jgi:hypothetical protein
MAYRLDVGYSDAVITTSLLQRTAQTKNQMAVTRVYEFVYTHLVTIVLTCRNVKLYRALPQRHSFISRLKLQKVSFASDIYGRPSSTNNQQTNKLLGLNPRANYTERTTAACRQS